jgi:DNA adenine methylase
VELGFALFFLNRTNRSGILDARPIGGHHQAGRWKIDARFDRGGLENRIRALGQYGSRDSVREVDGIDLIAEYLDDRQAFIYADHPYLGKGDQLYLDTLGWEDHVRLAQILQGNGRWLVTYDTDPRITDDLYAESPCAKFAMTHSAAIQHVGEEYAIFAPSLNVPTLSGLGSGDSASFV